MWPAMLHPRTPYVRRVSALLSFSLLLRATDSAAAQTGRRLGPSCATRPRRRSGRTSPWRALPSARLACSQALSSAGSRIPIVGKYSPRPSERPTSRSRPPHRAVSRYGYRSDAYHVNRCYLTCGHRCRCTDSRQRMHSDHIERAIRLARLLIVSGSRRTRARVGASAREGQACREHRFRVRGYAGDATSRQNRNGHIGCA